jgi:hypothetical protein
MTASEMEDVLKNLDLRTSRIEQILPTLATKEDLKAFATKEDLKAYATREDLKALATKEELQAVKKELQEAIQEVDRHAKVMYESVKSDTQMIAEYVASMKGEAR